MAQKPTTQELSLWLEWANAKLIAMPGGRIGPKEPTAVKWPDFDLEPFQVLDFRNQRLKALAPTGAEIEIMDIVLLWPALCSKELGRRVIHLRSAVHPLNHRHIFPWDRIAKKLQVKIATAKFEYKRGIIEVAANVPQGAVCKVSTFFGSR